MTRWFARMVAIAVAGFAATGSAKADFVIDDFAAPNPAFVYNISLTDPNPLSRLADATPHAGITRDLHIQVTLPSPPPGNATTGSIGSGQFEFSNAASTQANAILTYNGPIVFDGNILRITFSSFNPGNNTTSGS